MQRCARGFVPHPASIDPADGAALPSFILGTRAPFEWSSTGLWAGATMSSLRPTRGAKDMSLTGDELVARLMRASELEVSGKDRPETNPKKACTKHG